MLRFCAAIVHRSFRKFEHFADWLTGAAGPVFITICWLLVGMGAWSYFTTMFSMLTPIPSAYQSLWSGRASIAALPLLSWNALCEQPFLMIRFLVTLSGCLFIGYSVFFHYYMAITEPPGGVMTGLSPALNEHRLGPGSSSWWLEIRKRVARLSPLSLRSHSGLVVVPSKPIRLLKSTESSERLERARQERTSQSRVSFPFNTPGSNFVPNFAPNFAPSTSQAAASVAVSGPSSVPPSSASVPPSAAMVANSSISPTMTPRRVKSQRTAPRQPRSPQSMRRASTPDTSLEHSMLSAHAKSHSNQSEDPSLAGRAGHHSPDLAPGRPRNSDVLIAPKPRAGAIHHMPTMPMSTGFQFPGGAGSMAMSAPSSLSGGPTHVRFNSSPRSSIDTTNSTFIGGHSAPDPLLEDIDSDDFFAVAKMCHKCPRIPLFKALAALPPEMRSIERAIRSRNHWPPRPRTLSRQYSPNPEEGEDGLADEVPDGDLALGQDETEEDIRAWLGEEEAWQLVPPPKPERTHHCSVCKTCILKYDHHCPWLNQCVGLGNERYFVLFMAWLAVACIIISATGWPVARAAFQHRTVWSHPYTPRVCVLITWLLALVIGLGVGVMAAWQLLLVTRGETSVESHDNQHYAMLALRRGQRFQNVYDLGATQNLRLFFNTSTEDDPPSNASVRMNRSGSNVSAPGLHLRTASTESIQELERPQDAWSRILFPIRVAPYSDGWHWAKRRGLGGRHAGIESVEELTDDEEDYS